jgi:hypothetical protein
VTEGKWFHTFMVTLAFQLLGSLPGPFIGVVMLVIGGANVRFSNAVSSFLYAIFIPLAVIGISLAYRRLKGEPVIEPHMLTQDRDPARAEQTRALREEALGRSGLGTVG